ncbi:Arm DNA-binding domain-containing protein [Daejeonella sp.]|uniref:Arm DNA-binding domain-containing protein n=1 Tax=Daejeonella sp. TaxID=2805397 RepID=UPI003523C9A1
MRLTYSIKTVLRQDKKKADNLIPIYYSVRVGPHASRLPTGKYTLLKDWNVKDNCPKSNTKENQLLGTYLQQQLAKWQIFMLEFGIVPEIS